MSTLYERNKADSAKLAIGAGLFAVIVLIIIVIAECVSKYSIN